MDYRVENKYLVTDADIAVLRPRLAAVMKQDIHQLGSGALYIYLGKLF